MRESPIERAFCAEVEKHGGKAYKWVSPGNSGVPDRIVFLKGMCFLVELKATTGRLRAQQKIQKKTLSALGFEVVVINSIEQARLWVELQAAVLERMAIPYQDVSHIPVGNYNWITANGTSAYLNDTTPKPH